MLAEAGVAHEVATFEHDPRVRIFGDEAVRELTRDGTTLPDQVYKTLVIEVPDGLAVAIVPALARLSLKAAAAVLGARRVTMANGRAVERATGYVLGAVSPLGLRTRLPTVIDAGAMTLQRIYVSAGRRGWDVALAPADLVRLTGAVTADILA